MGLRKPPGAPSPSPLRNPLSGPSVHECALDRKSPAAPPRRCRACSRNGIQVWNCLVAKHPRPAVGFFGGAIPRLSGARRVLRLDGSLMRAARAALMRGVSALLVPLPSLPVLRAHRAQIDHRKDFRSQITARRATCRKAALGERSKLGETSAPFAIVFVNGHKSPYLATDRSAPPLIIFFGPSALGVMSNSKISVGTNTVAHALGMSTMPLM